MAIRQQSLMPSLSAWGQWPIADAIRLCTPSFPTHHGRRARDLPRPRGLNVHIDAAEPDSDAVASLEDEIHGRRVHCPATAAAPECPQRCVLRLPHGVAILTNLILYSSPFEKVKLVLKHRSAVFINIHMVCAGTFNTLTWVIYTALSRQWIIFGPNLFCFVMGCVQIVLYLTFHPSTHPYDGPILGVTPTEERIVDVELGALPFGSLEKTRAKTAEISQPESPMFVALESPL